MRFFGGIFWWCSKVEMDRGDGYGEGDSRAFDMTHKGA